MGTAITGSALPFILQMSLALSICRKRGGNEILVFSSQARLARIFISSDGQDSASACYSVRAALQLPTALGWQGHGAGLWPTVQGG